MCLFGELDVCLFATAAAPVIICLNTTTQLLQFLHVSLTELSLRRVYKCYMYNVHV